jgi:hypothetical protein
MVAFTETQIKSRNNIINNMDNVITNPNINKNYDTILVESEMIKKKQDTIFLVSSITAVILVIVTINIIKK